MKNPLILLTIALLSVVMVSAQSNKKKTEVLYFKANLCACKARVCTAIGNDIKTIIEKYYPDSSVKFREVKLTDEENNEMVTKYKARSQSLIIVKQKRKKEFFVDVSDIVQAYGQNQDKVVFEKTLQLKINEIKKK